MAFKAQIKIERGKKQIMKEREQSIHKLVFWLQIGAVLMFLAVALGAFGAHGLEKILEPKQMETWNKAVVYLTTHALALLMLSGLFYGFPQNAKAWTVTAWCFLLGILLFSGSLFLWVLTQIHWLVFLTPVGGTLFLIGWLWLLFSARKLRFHFERSF